MLCSACLWFIDHTHSFGIIYADVTVHAQAQCWKRSSHETAMLQGVGILRYSGYRVRGVCALQNSSSHLRCMIYSSQTVLEHHRPFVCIRCYIPWSEYNIILKDRLSSSVPSLPPLVSVHTPSLCMREKAAAY